MPDKLSEMLNFLAEDGRWHTVREVAEAVGVSLEKAEKLLKDLSEFRFVHFDERGRVRIDPELKRRLRGYSPSKSLSNLNPFSVVLYILEPLGDSTTSRRPLSTRYLTWTWKRLKFKLHL